MSRPLSVLVAGGGSAGHIEPALAVATVLRARGHRVALLGTESGLEATVVPARGFELEVVPRVPLPRRPDASTLTLPRRLVGAVRQAGEVLRRRRVDVVLGVGGYVCVPAYLAARRARVPIVVHEANVVPGLANRLGARLTRHVAVSVAGTGLPHAVLTGLPLRSEVVGLDRAARRAGARAELGLPTTGPVLLVTGGSQGARRINEAVTGAADALAEVAAVLHVSGLGQAEAVATALAGGPASHVVLSYAHDMAACYAAADLVLCRAGAVTCAELAAVGLPAVLVPLPIGNGEQRRNAEPAVATGAAMVVDDAELTAAWLRAHVVPLLADPALLAPLAAAAGARRQEAGLAAERVADLVERAGQTVRP